ncbi:SMP-30/gluconolactonase/LRE family protein [Frankia sp. AgKG'84/4]|uniref:SMP-30/gluconolactonase/LRE family protein n=1 Tax=Frankia sp. AgKG'84/4 TaxID=573490 RepID=UPI00200F0637|nr:hypothetical protein [Frankia sp. AgKG'84/4]MCL9793629.1 hypothetical protein [Frankia sp. AgKG'84/4]
MRRQVRALGGMAAISAAILAGTATQATAATPPLSDPRVAAHFDIDAGQTPEGIALEPDGSALISLTNASSVVRVRGTGRVELLGALPRTGACPILQGSFSSGIARAADGTIYVVNCTGNADSGVWRIRGHGSPEQIAHLPADAFPNGLTLDERTGNLYIADSNLGVVWKVPRAGGVPVVWAKGPELARVDLFGANGITVRGRYVWVSNTDTGTIVKIPVAPNGSAGPIQTVVSGIAGGLDNFTVFGRDDAILAAVNGTSEVVLLRRGQAPQVVLTAADGLSNPTHVQLRGNTVYVSNGAFFTRTDPNLLVARLDRRP